MTPTETTALIYRNSVERNDHTIPLFVDADDLPVKFLYFELVCFLMYSMMFKTRPPQVTFSTF